MQLQVHWVTFAAMLALAGPAHAQTVERKGGEAVLRARAPIDGVDSELAGTCRRLTAPALEVPIGTLRPGIFAVRVYADQELVHAGYVLQGAEGPPTFVAAKAQPLTVNDDVWSEWVKGWKELGAKELRGSLGEALEEYLKENSVAATGGVVVCTLAVPGVPPPVQIPAAKECFGFVKDTSVELVMGFLKKATERMKISAAAKQAILGTLRLVEAGKAFVELNAPMASVDEALERAFLAAETLSAEIENDTCRAIATMLVQSGNKLRIILQVTKRAR